MHGDAQQRVAWPSDTAGCAGTAKAFGANSLGDKANSDVGVSVATEYTA
jgi:hypothetical protein